MVLRKNPIIGKLQRRTGYIFAAVRSIFDKAK